MNATYTLKYDKSVLLLPESKTFKFGVKVTTLNTWDFNIKLIDDTTKETAGYEVIIKGKDITIELNRWYSETWIENIEPIVIEGDKQSNVFLKIKIRVAMNPLQPFKNLIISVWQKN